MGNFEEELFYRTLPGDCFWNLGQKNFMPLWSVSKCSIKNKNVTEAATDCSVKKMFLRVLQISQKTPVLETLFNKVAGLQVNYIKKRNQHRCFPVNNAKFLRTPTLKNICIKLLLVFCKNRNVRPKFSS